MAASPPALTVVCKDLPAPAAHGLETLLGIIGLPLAVRTIRPEEVEGPACPTLLYLPPGELRGILPSLPGAVAVPRTELADGPLMPRPMDLGQGQSVNIPTCAIPDTVPQGALPLDIFNAAFIIASGYFEKIVEDSGTAVNSQSTRCSPPSPDFPVVDAMAGLLGEALASACALSGLPHVRVLPQPPGRTMTYLLAMDFDTFHKGLLERMKQVYGLQRIARNMAAAGSTPGAVLRHVLAHLAKLVPGGTYDRIPQVREWLNERGLRSSFYIYFRYTPAGDTRGRALKRWVYDPDYDIPAMPDYIRTLRAMQEEGHDIGQQHGAFSTHASLDAIRDQRDNFEKTLGFPPTTCRHHFLSHSISRYHETLERAGFLFDSSPAYLDRSGFRYGTVSPCRGYNFLQGRPSPVLQCPTPLWDGTLNSGILPDWNAMKAEMDAVLETTARFSGTIVSGVHPRSFATRDYYGSHWRTFEYALDKACSLGARTQTCESFRLWWEARATVRAQHMDTTRAELKTPRGTPLSLEVSLGDAKWVVDLADGSKVSVTRLCGDGAPPAATVDGDRLVLSFSR